MRKRTVASTTSRTKAIRSGAKSVKGDLAAKFNPSALFEALGARVQNLSFRHRQTVFRQGDVADALYYVKKGRVGLTVTSAEGKQRVIAILDPGQFFGEGCLAGQVVQISTAGAMSSSDLIRVPRGDMIELLHTDKDLAEMFTAFLLRRNLQIQEDLIDHMFNSSERRLARVLLMLANFGKEGEMDLVIPPVSQELLAERVGTTRSRINAFMNKFRRLGYIEYNGTLKVHRGLVNILIHD